MKNNKNLAIYLIGVSFFLIFTGCVSSFVIGLREDQRLVKARMADVSNTFEEFSTNVSLYEEYRDNLYSEVLGTLYYDTMLQGDKLVKEKLSNYEAIVDQIFKQTNSLDKLCRDVYYPDSKINSKCTNYKSIYEQVVNYFVTDIKFYNKSVEDFNKYSAAIGSTNILNGYTTKKKFIDFNKDGNFDGRED